MIVSSVLGTIFRHLTTRDSTNCCGSHQWCSNSLKHLGTRKNATINSIFAVVFHTIKIHFRNSKKCNILIQMQLNARPLNFKQPRHALGWENAPSWKGYIWVRRIDTTIHKTIATIRQSVTTIQEIKITIWHNVTSIQETIATIRQCHDYPET